MVGLFFRRILAAYQSIVSHIGPNVGAVDTAPSPGGSAHVSGLESFNPRWIAIILYFRNLEIGGNYVGSGKKF